MTMTSGKLKCINCFEPVRFVSTSSLFTPLCDTCGTFEVSFSGNFEVNLEFGRLKLEIGEVQHNEIIQLLTRYVADKKVDV